MDTSLLQSGNTAPSATYSGPTPADDRTMKAPSSSIKDKIRLFDRPLPPPPPTLIQKRMTQLSNKWELDGSKKKVASGVCGRTGKPALPPKVEWYTSPSTGKYKKRLQECCD